MNIFYDYQSIYRQKFGGVSRYHYELYVELAKMQGINVKCQCYRSPNYYFKDILGYYSTKKHYGLPDIYCHLNKITNWQQIMFGSYDIIHPTWYDPYCFVKKNKGKYVITIHDMIHEKFPGFPVYETENKRYWIHQADKIIAVSENTKKDILDIYPEIDKEKISVVYHGCNKLPLPKAVNGLPKTYLLYVGQRGYSYKNFNVVLQAMKVILEKSPEQRLICAGGGDFTDEEKSLIRNLGLEDYVQQMRVTDEELAYLYSHAWCLVYPSLYEGFGFPILEAFMCQCPVILSHSSSLPEVAGDAALYFEPHDVNMMVDDILSLSEQSLREELIQKEKERVKLFSWRKTAVETLKVYESLEII